MRINIYNYNILTPAKCGSRFLDTLFDTKEWPNGKEIIPKGSKIGSGDTYQIKKVIDLESMDEEVDIDKIDWIILRPPNDLMLSAIHTEMLMCWNKKFERENDVSENDVVKSLTLDGKNGHYSSNLYRNLCFMWMKSKKRIKFVHLEDLTLFSKEILGPDYPLDSIVWDANSYNFSNYDIWFSKDDIATYCKSVYNDYWRQLQSNLVKESFFWNSILEGAEFYTPKVQNKKQKSSKT
jgi:hypothetical protein